MKPLVFKNEGKWYSARETFGFQSRVDCVEHDRWLDALKEARRAGRDNGSGHTLLTHSDNPDAEHDAIGWGWS